MTSESLNQALLLSEQMLSLAIHGEWSKVEALQPERDRLLKRYFEPPLADDPVSVRSAIETVIRHDQQIIELGRRYKTELGQQLKALTTGKSALKAYRGS